MTARDMQQMNILIVKSEDRNRGEIVMLSRFASRIAGKNNSPEPALTGNEIIPAQPVGFDHVAVRRYWILLVLSGKDLASHRSALRLQALRGAAIRLQRLARGTAIDLAFAEFVFYRLRRDCGQNQRWPSLIDQYAR